MKLFEIFKRKPTELEELLLRYLKNDGLKGYAEQQSKSQQEHYWRLKEKERIDRINEKYEYEIQKRKQYGIYAS